jgi:hypothetical protein
MRLYVMLESTMFLPAVPAILFPISDALYAERQVPLTKSTF